MQVSFNNQQRNENFGMALKVTESAKEVLRNRKMSNTDIDKLGKLIDKFQKNPVSITIDTYNGSKELNGLVWLNGKHSKNYSEGYFSSIFKSPIKFIEKLCKKAEEVDNFYNHNKLDDVLK